MPWDKVLGLKYSFLKWLVIFGFGSYFLTNTIYVAMYGLQHDNSIHAFTMWTNKDN